MVALEVVGDDVQAAYDYFADRLTSGGDRFLERYFEVVDRIALNPETYRLVFDDYRRVLVPRSHMAVYYFVEKERAIIVAVIDARRRPSAIRGLVRGRR